MSMSLARAGDGEKLSMFYLKTRDTDGKLNNIQVKKDPVFIETR